MCVGNTIWFKRVTHRSTAYGGDVDDLWTSRFYSVRGWRQTLRGNVPANKQRNKHVIITFWRNNVFIAFCVCRGFAVNPVSLSDVIMCPWPFSPTGNKPPHAPMSFQATPLIHFVDIYFLSVECYLSLKDQWVNTTQDFFSSNTAVRHKHRVSTINNSK